MEALDARGINSNAVRSFSEATEGIIFSTSRVFLLLKRWTLLVRGRRPRNYQSHTLLEKKLLVRKKFEPRPSASSHF